MYNRYISQDSEYGPIPTSHHEEPPPPPRSGGGLGGLLGGLLHGVGGAGEGGKIGEKVNEALSALCKSVGIQELDTGDILLALIVLLLILEDGDDLELLIALGLMLVLHLGEQ